jgi:hypothetical protein
MPPRWTGHVEAHLESGGSSVVICRVLGVYDTTALATGRKDPGSRFER